jgi:hypothetical protein
MSHIPELPEPGQHNLRRALLELPRHEPADAVWARLDAHLGSEQNLRRAILELPRHEPADIVWERIQGQLVGERAVDRAVHFLPAHEPDDDLWATISARLNETPTATSPLAVAPPDTQALVTEPAYSAPAPVLRRLWSAHVWRMAASAAAAVLLVALVWWQRPRPAADATVAQVTTSAGQAQETISYSEETITLPAEARAVLATANDPLETQGLSFIDAHCTSLPSVCGSSEFQELRTQLNELEAEEQRLEQDARRFGTTPELVQDQVRVTTLKATVTRELIQMLIS